MQVAIIGAGISGLVCALLLKERLGNQSVEITLYEQRNSIEPIGGALSIWPNGVKVLLSISSKDEIQKLAGSLRYENWGDNTGVTLRVVDREELLNINGFPFMNICRSELQELLLNQFGKENVKFGAKVYHIEQTQDKTTMFFSDGESAVADIIIGADGIYSTIRRLIFPNNELTYTGYITLVGILNASLKQSNHIIWGKNRLLLNFPVSDEREMVYTAAPLPKGDLKKKYNTRGKQFSLFYGWSEEVDCILSNLQQDLVLPQFANHYFCSENYDMPSLTALNVGRVVLVGDAAHPMGSIMGFGANIALEDVKVLVESLNDEKNIIAALDQYSTKQLNRARPMINLELEKKHFLLQASDSQYTDFKQYVKKASHKNFFGAIYQALE